MGTVRYTVIDGEVIAQERDGVRHQLVPDALGSIVALYDDSGTKTDTFSYWPYGESAVRTGTSNNKFQYVGALGYYSDSVNYYVRARFFDPKKGRWVTEDPIGFDGNDYNIYRYVNNSPAVYRDPSGLVIPPWCWGCIGCLTVSAAVVIGQCLTDDKSDGFVDCVKNWCDKNPMLCGMMIGVCGLACAMCLGNLIGNVCKGGPKPGPKPKPNPKPRPKPGRPRVCTVLISEIDMGHDYIGVKTCIWQCTDGGRCFTEITSGFPCLPGPCVPVF